MSPQVLNKPIPVQYHKGILKILVSLPLIDGEKFDIEIIKPRKKAINKKSDFSYFKKILERSYGIAPDLPDGLKFTQQIRKEWDDEVKRKWHE